MADDFQALKARVEASRGNNRSAVTDLLKHIRTNRMREPQLVLSLWGSISTSCSSLGDEQWTILEQVCLAALDMQDSATAVSCLRELRLKFPESARVRRLVGMEREAAGEFEQAEAVYRDMLESNPANQAALKRQVNPFPRPVLVFLSPLFRSHEGPTHTDRPHAPGLPCCSL